MNTVDALKLTMYFGERGRLGRGFLADTLLDLFERHAFQTSVLLRGIEGFGLKHHLHTERFLTLSEDLPVVAIAVDTRDRIEGALPEVRSLTFHGLVTLERARMLSDGADAVVPPDGDGVAGEAKLTIYCGRRERIGARLAYLEVVDFLHRHGVAGATVLLGVDGTVQGTRARARFFGRNAEVPLMIISVGDGQTLSGLLPELAAMLRRPLFTLERIRVCKRDGLLLAEPHILPERDASGLPVWQKLMVYAGEQARHGSHPLYVELVHELRRAGAGGATALRGIWGYHGDHSPHGDRLLALRRHVPVLTVIVDTPDRIRRWFEIIDRVTPETGLVTSELVPAFHATGPGIERGGPELAEPVP